MATGRVPIGPTTPQLITGDGLLIRAGAPPRTRDALRWGVDEAALHDAPIVPVHVHQHVVTGEECVDLPQLEQAERASLRAEVASAGGAGRAAEPEVVVGHPAAGLESLASPADLLVVGSRGRGGTGLLLGSTSTQLAQHATAAVLVVRSA